MIAKLHNKSILADLPGVLSGVHLLLKLGAVNAEMAHTNRQIHYYNSNPAVAFFLLGLTQCWLSAGLITVETVCWQYLASPPTAGNKPLADYNIYMLITPFILHSRGRAMSLWLFCVLCGFDIFCRIFFQVDSTVGVTCMLSISSTNKHNKQINYIMLVLPQWYIFFSFFFSGEENSPGWLYGDDEGKTMAPFSCPLLASHMPVFAAKSPERKVNLLLPKQEKKIISNNISATRTNHKLLSLSRSLEAHRGNK